jgi:hypothetical protein
MRSFEQTTYRNDTQNPARAYEAMLHIGPLLIPPHQSSLQLESLKQTQIASEFGDRVTHYWQCIATPGNSEHAGVQEPMDAPNIRQCQIAPIVDVQVRIQIVGPHM